jgi:malonyl-CoA O-methyltransferase
VNSETYALDRSRVAKAFGRAGGSFEKHAILHQQVGGEMLQRLGLLRIEPNWILDVGAATGYGSRLLTKRYPKAYVALLDLALGMLTRARRNSPRFFSRASYVQAAMERLPLADASLDMVFSNLALQWSADLEACFFEVRRALSPSGLFMFSTFGPDTLKELRMSWAEVDSYTHVNAFVDMHDIGDALIRAGFSSPVLDVERVTLTYESFERMFDELRGLGSINATAGRNRALTGKGRLAQLRRAYNQYRRESRYPVTCEIVYGHAWAPTAGTRPQDGSTVATFPVSALRRRARD